MAMITRSKNLNRSVCLVAVVTAFSLAGCGTSRMTTGSVSRDGGSTAALGQMNGGQLASARESYSKAYARNPKDVNAAIAYANILRMTGQNDQSLAVMRQTAIYYPNDMNVLAAYGKALASAGEMEAALDAIQRAQRPELPDWKLLSAEGAILDQMGKPDEARDRYRKALDLKPNEASIQSNLGMSYLLQGDLRTAETYFAAAARSPGADSTVRQNLALAIGLQGRFDEAEQVARRELSPEQAEANVAYLRRMLAQQDSLGQLKQADAQQGNG